MSDEEYDNAMEEMEEDEAAYDSDYAYESDGLGDENDESGNTGMDAEDMGNSFHVLMDPNETTTEEWRAIYSQIRNIVVKSQRKVNYEWDARHEKNFRFAIVYIESLKERSCFYPFRINFHATADLCFPEVPPQIQPLFPLPAALFVMISKHPLLTAKHWNPCQDLVIIMDFIVTLLDQQLNHLEATLLANPVAGGNLTRVVRSAEEANEWLKEPLHQLSMEQLISFLYGYYMFEIPYHPEILDQFVKGERLLTACPLNLKKDLPKYSGIGYSRDAHYSSGRKDTANTAQQSQSAVVKILAILKEKFDVFLTLLERHQQTTSNSNGSTANSSSSSKIALPEEEAEESHAVIRFEQDFTVEVAHRFAIWIYESPLLYILQRKIAMMASGDIVREAKDDLIQFDLLLRLERIYSSSGIAIDTNSETLFLESYQKLYGWSQADLFSEESKTSWLPTFQTQSRFWREIREKQQAEQTSSFSKERTRDSLTPEDDAHCKSDGTTPASKVRKVETSQRVIYVPGLERHHTHYSSLGIGVEKCNRFFLKELKTLPEALPEEVTVFVAEEHPNYLMALFSIRNEDSPYYGGMFLFHVMIPESYPAVSPKVQFMTTGYGSVRFNPNLYNSGKVCLSLLGTWSGEPWDPKTSNLNQVLSSILFLIFTEEPFYNEPGYDRNGQRAYVKESEQYDGTVIGNVVSYGILDHLIKPYPVTPIYQAIRDYFENHWEHIAPILDKKLKYHQENKSLHRPWETIQSELATIHSHLQKK